MLNIYVIAINVIRKSSDGLNDKMNEIRLIGYLISVSKDNNERDEIAKFRLCVDEKRILKPTDSLSFTIIQ